MEWQDGYITEIEYVPGVYRELAPSLLNMVLLVQSLEPVPLEEGFTYCDLGCGHGESDILFAACHPGGTFHAVDFNSAHIASARSLAGKAEIANVTFWEASFAHLHRLPLPDFDYVVLHGIYSWVGDDNRQHILDFLRRKLKPGGVVYLSYNSLPGWSAHAPLRQLLSSYADTQSGTLEERVELALDFARKLKDAKALLFEGNAATSDFLDYILTLPRNYLAHEFFNREWSLFYHAEVVRALAAARLTFAGSAHFADNQDMLRFTAEQQQVLDSVKDRVLRETVKDFTITPLLRRDVFTKGRPWVAPAQQLVHFRQRRLALVVPQERLERKAAFPIGEVLFDRGLYDPILNAFTDGPQTLEELLQRQEVGELGMTRVIEALMVLISAEYILPAVEPSRQAVLATRKLNRILLERSLAMPGRQFLASPVLQNSVKLDWLERLLVICELDGNDDPMPWVLAMMEQHHLLLERDGEPLESKEEILAEVAERIHFFRGEQLPLLRQLGIL
jgi:SAM-dependent methyltransferase